MMEFFYAESDLADAIWNCGDWKKGAKENDDKDSVRNHGCVGNRDLFPNSNSD